MSLLLENYTFLTSWDRGKRTTIYAGPGGRFLKGFLTLSKYHILSPHSASWSEFASWKAGKNAA